MASSDGKTTNTSVSLPTHHKRNIAFTCKIAIMATARVFEDIKNVFNFLMKTKVLVSSETSENTDTTQSHISGYKLSHLK